MNEVLYEADGAIARIRLNRPESLNAINGALLNGLADALVAVTQSPDVRIVVLSGNGRAFCAGDDLKELENKQAYRDYYAGLVERLQEITRSIMFSDKIFIAVVNGWAIGGGLSWVLNADYSIFESDAGGFFPELTLGLYMSGAATALLPALVGRQRAMQLFVSGARFTSQEAKLMGIASEVVDAGEGLSRSSELCRTLLMLPPETLTSLKSVQADVFRDSINIALQTEQDCLKKQIASFKKAKRLAEAIR